MIKKYFATIYKFLTLKSKKLGYSYFDMFNNIWDGGYSLMQAYLFKLEQLMDYIAKHGHESNRYLYAKDLVKHGVENDFVYFINKILTSKEVEDGSQVIHYKSSEKFLDGHISFLLKIQKLDDKILLYINKRYASSVIPPESIPKKNKLYKFNPDNTDFEEAEQYNYTVENLYKKEIPADSNLLEEVGKFIYESLKIYKNFKKDFINFFGLTDVFDVNGNDFGHLSNQLKSANVITGRIPKFHQMWQLRKDIMDYNAFLEHDDWYYESVRNCKTKKEMTEIDKEFNRRKKEKELKIFNNITANATSWWD